MAYELEEKFYELDTPDYRKAAQILLDDLRAYVDVDHSSFHSTVKVICPAYVGRIRLIIWDCGTLNFVYQLECSAEIPDTEYGMSATVAHGPDKTAVENYLLKCLSLPEKQNMLNTKIEGLADMAEDWDWPDDEW